MWPFESSIGVVYAELVEAEMIVSEVFKTLWPGFWPEVAIPADPEAFCLMNRLVVLL